MARWLSAPPIALLLSLVVVAVASLDESRQAAAAGVPMKNGAEDHLPDPEEGEVIPQRGEYLTTAQLESAAPLPVAPNAGAGEKPPHLWVSTEAEPLIELTDDDFEAALFGDIEGIKQKKSRVKEVPFLIMFYAPWCPHCTRLKPVFGNASLLAREKGQQAASFAMVDGTKPLPTLAKRYGIRVKSYPTIYYSVMGKIYLYEGSRSVQNFIYVARLLHLAAIRDYGVMDDLREPAILRSIEAKEPIDLVSYFFALPAGPDGYSIGNSVVDAVITIGRARYAWIPLAEWETLVKSPSAVGRQVAGALLKARSCTRGPLGALLIVTSEGLKNPRAYCGGWFFGKGVNTTVSAGLIDWFHKTAFPAIQIIDADTWPFLAQRGLVMVGAFAGALPDAKSPAFRGLTALAQHINEDQTSGRKEISIGILNGLDNSAFMDSVHVHTFPSLFVVNTDHEEAYYLPEDLQATLAQSVDPWSDATFAAGLERWVSNIMHGRATPAKYHWYGRVAAVLVQLPLVGWVHDVLGLGDLEFVAVMAMAIVTPVLLLVAARGGEDLPPSPTGVSSKAAPTPGTSASGKVSKSPPQSVGNEEQLPGAAKESEGKKRK